MPQIGTPCRDDVEDCKHQNCSPTRSFWILTIWHSRTCDLLVAFKNECASYFQAEVVFSMHAFFFIWQIIRAALHPENVGCAIRQHAILTGWMVLFKNWCNKSPLRPRAHLVLGSRVLFSSRPLQIWGTLPNLVLFLALFCQGLFESGVSQWGKKERKGERMHLLMCRFSEILAGREKERLWGFWNVLDDSLCTRVTFVLSSVVFCVLYDNRWWITLQPFLCLLLC